MVRALEVVMMLALVAAVARAEPPERPLPAWYHSACVQVDAC